MPTTSLRNPSPFPIASRQHITSWRRKTGHAITDQHKPLLVQSKLLAMRHTPLLAQGNSLTMQHTPLLVQGTGRIYS